MKTTPEFGIPVTTEHGEILVKPQTIVCSQGRADKVCGMLEKIGYSAASAISPFTLAPIGDAITSAQEYWEKHPLAALTKPTDTKLKFLADLLARSDEHRPRLTEIWENIYVQISDRAARVAAAKTLNPLASYAISESDKAVAFGWKKALAPVVCIGRDTLQYYRGPDGSLIELDTPQNNWGEIQAQMSISRNAPYMFISTGYAVISALLYPGPEYSLKDLVGAAEAWMLISLNYDRQAYYGFSRFQAAAEGIFVRFNSNVPFSRAAMVRRPGGLDFDDEMVKGAMSALKLDGQVCFDHEVLRALDPTVVLEDRNWMPYYGGLTGVEQAQIQNIRQGLINPDKVQKAILKSQEYMKDLKRMVDFFQAVIDSPRIDVPPPPLA